jgi:ABC-type uncharacterized transport system substrate-binding protein
VALAGCSLAPVVEPESEPEAPAKELIVLQSDASPAFAGVTRAIAEKWKGGLTIVKLNGSAAANAEAVRKLPRGAGRVLVAVGLTAALEARKLRDIKAIFCQVFNYEDHDLISASMKGVSATPSVTQQFQIWKKLDPNLKHVGVITGPRLLSLVAEARAAAAASGIQLTHVQVASDLETLYAFKKLSPKIQALWLLPDNRVLSRNTIRELLAYSRMQAKQVAVFSAQLLSLGGVISVDSVYSDIAEQVIARSLQALAADGPEVPGPAVVPLARLDFKINPLALEQLGLVLPAELKGSAYVP